MEGNDQEFEQETTPEQEAAGDAAFEAAFNTTRGIAPHVEGTSQDDASGQPLVTEGQDEQDADNDADAQAKAEAASQAQAQAAADAEANAPVAITKAELDALRAVAGQVTALQDELKRSNDKTNGHIGSMKQTLEAVKAQAQQGKKPTLNQLKRLEAEFPELANLLTQDLEEAFGSGNAAQAEAPEANHQAGDGDKASGADAPGANPPADPFADPRVRQTLRDKEMSIVDVIHPGWRDTKATPEFNEWRTGLPAAAQELLGSTWDAKVMSDAFTDFKTWNTKRAAAATANKQRGKRLENGIPATTGVPTGANAVDDDAAFLAGFKQARGQR